MSETSKTNSGFALPVPVNNAPTTTTTTETVILPPGAVVSDTSSRDLLIGGAILLLLFVGFFFAKNAYANTLVAKRVPPNKANAAGWWLFVFLASLATGVVLSAVNASQFMKPLILGPIGLISLLALVLMLVSGRK
jgi:hypothetical protein